MSLSRVLFGSHNLKIKKGPKRSKNPAKLFILDPSPDTFAPIQVPFDWLDWNRRTCRRIVWVEFRKVIFSFVNDQNCRSRRKLYQGYVEDLVLEREKSCDFRRSCLRRCGLPSPPSCTGPFFNIPVSKKLL